MQRQKEIESLRQRLARLEAEEAQEQKERAALEETYQQLQASLEAAGLGMDAFVRAFYKEIRKVTSKIERENAKTEAPPQKRSVKKKAGAKKPRKKSRPTVTVKIPAGNYHNIPAAPDQVFIVKEKGPRPKVLKAYAEEIGLEQFLQQCRMEA